MKQNFLEHKLFGTRMTNSTLPFVTYNRNKPSADHAQRWGGKQRMQFNLSNLYSPISLQINKFVEPHQGSKEHSWSIFAVHF